LDDADVQGSFVILQLDDASVRGSFVILQLDDAGVRGSFVILQLDDAGVRGSFAVRLQYRFDKRAYIKINDLKLKFCSKTI
jgi:hypothetical protein